MEQLIRNENKELIYLNEKKESITISIKEEVLYQGEQAAIILPELEGHPIFTISSKTGCRFVRERHLWKTGIVNFRDLGGYQTQDGSYVKYGCFYRSAAFIRLQKEHQRVLDSLKLMTLLDLRSNQEVFEKPDEVPSQCRYLQISGIPMFDNNFQGNLNFERLGNKSDLSKVALDMDQIYADLPLNNRAYQEMFRLLMQQEMPLVFHCSAGKDRTGVGAALILLALGVDEKLVIEDYLFSNECRKEENERLFKLNNNYSPEFKAMMTVQQHLIEASLTSIKTQYDNYDEYFLKEFGLDREKRAQLQDWYCTK